MKDRSLPPIAWKWILGVAALKLLLHLITNTYYSYHRDELLYLALGQHPAFGYWSNPPLIGWISALLQATLGDSVFAVRLISSLAGSGLVVVTGLMARELRGGTYAQVLAALAVFFSPAYMRSASMFQPVIFDILGWTVLTYLLLRYLNTERRSYLLWFGFAFGIGMLNKYSLVFYLLALIPALLISPYRKVLWSKGALYSALIALLLVLPNLIWQYRYDFPVVTHMSSLAANQLVNVSARGFLIGQLLMNATSLLIWTAGVFFLFTPKARPYRVVGFLFLFVIGLFLFFQGKSYYSLGIYPVVMAAGSVFWENILSKWWLRLALPALMLLSTLPLFPLCLPVLKVDRMVAYCDRVANDWGMEGPMVWETGVRHELPQDYADMLAWEEIHAIVAKAYQESPDPTHTLIYTENYGQAGAVEVFDKKDQLPPVASFSDTYRLWAPTDTDANTLIYVNDELGGDIQSLFGDIRKIGEVATPYARENGTEVYLCQQPKTDLNAFWKERLEMVLYGE